MKRSLLILVAGLILAAGAYYQAYRMGTASARDLLGQDHAELLWLKKEFNLGDQDYARILNLHTNQLAQCGARCEQIAEVDQKLQALLGQAHQFSTEIEDALGQRAKLRLVCETEMLRYAFDVSHSMPPEQARRYLAWVQQNTCLGSHGVDLGMAQHGKHH